MPVKPSRIHIFGNSGAGKSYLAKALSEILKIPVIHLDDVFWEPGGFISRRPESVVYKEVDELSRRPSWIMEGIYGDLAERIAAKADVLIFLDKTWKDCETGLKTRGPQDADSLDPIIRQRQFNELLDWAKDYHLRPTLSSFSGHNRVFENFQGMKFRITNFAETDNLIKQFKDMDYSI